MAETTPNRPLYRGPLDPNAPSLGNGAGRWRPSASYGAEPPCRTQDAYAQHAAEVDEARAVFDAALRTAEIRLRRALKAVETK